MSDVAAGFGVPASPEAVRAEVRAWIGEHWRAEMALLEWRTELVDAQWAMPSWPVKWNGRGLPTWADDVVTGELARAGAAALPVGVGVSLAAPTILAHGPDALRERFLREILTGSETWCQLFSEPGAGSDLAGLVTRAELDGDEWIVDGQKVWNTSAHHADLGLLVARTDWSVPKHKGLTYFALPMRQPGVEVRPLRQMNHHSSFNEVFITEARIPRQFVIGDVGDGWRVALSTLAFERRFGVMRPPALDTAPGRALDEARAEAAAHFETYKWYPQRAGRVDLVASRATATGTSTDPTVRQHIARATTTQKVSAWTAERAHASRALGRTPGPEGSIGKLATSILARQAARAHSTIAGASGMLSGADSPLEGVIAEVLVSTPAQSIAGGTDEIQRNILGEKALALPREPSVDRDIAFRDVRRN